MIPASKEQSWSVGFEGIARLFQWEHRQDHGTLQDQPCSLNLHDQVISG